MLETAAARGRFVACLAPGPTTQWLVTPSPTTHECHHDERFGKH
jgi:hypothetical protein